MFLQPRSVSGRQPGFHPGNVGSIPARGANTTMNHNRFFIDVRDERRPPIALLSDSHASWRPEAGSIVYLLHNHPWRVTETVPFGSHLIVRVEPVEANVGSPA